MATLRVIIVGAGSLGRRWFEVVEAHPDAAVVAVVDPLIGGPDAPGWLGQYPGLPLAKSLTELAPLTADAAVVTAFSPAHGAAVTACLEAGLHVLVEKPFVTSLADGERLVASAEGLGRTLMVNQNYRFFPGVQALRQRVQDGEGGGICAVFGQFWCDWPGKPYQHGMPHPMALEMAVHHFDLVRAIFDAEAEEGWVLEWNPPGSPYRHGGGALEGVFRMRGPSGSFPFSYSGSLVSKASPPLPWGGFWRWEFAAETLFAETAGEDYALFRREGAERVSLSPFGDPAMAFDKSFDHFCRALRDGTVPWPSGRDNLGTLRMVLNFFR